MGGRGWMVELGRWVWVGVFGLYLPWDVKLWPVSSTPMC